MLLLNIIFLQNIPEHLPLWCTYSIIVTKQVVVPCLPNEKKLSISKNHVYVFFIKYHIARGEGVRANYLDALLVCK